MDEASGVRAVLAEFMNAARHPIGCCLGLACVDAWAQVVFSDRFFSVPGAGTGFAATVHLVGTGVSIATALILALTWRASGHIVGSRGAAVAAGVAGMLGTLGVLLSGWGGFGDASALIFNALVCFSTVWLNLAWYSHLARSGPQARLRRRRS